MHQLSTAFSCRDLAVTRGNVEVLREISMHVARGEKLAVVGPSGSGKSTLLAVMALGLTWQSGEVYLQGRYVPPEVVRSDSRRRRYDLPVLVPQAPSLLRDRTVLENVALARALARGVPLSHAIAAASEAIEKVGLTSKLHERTRVLSGGEAQRVSVARALAVGNSFVLADEPTASLDRNNTKIVAELLVEASGSSALVVATHDPLVAEHCERAISLVQGQVEGDS